MKGVAPSPLQEIIQFSLAREKQIFRFLTKLRMTISQGTDDCLKLEQLKIGNGSIKRTIALCNVICFPFLSSNIDAMATTQTLSTDRIDSFEVALGKHFSEKPRYVPFKDRRLSGDMSVETMLNSCHGTCNFYFHVSR